MNSKLLKLKKTLLDMNTISFESKQGKQLSSLLTQVRNGSITFEYFLAQSNKAFKGELNE